MISCRELVNLLLDFVGEDLTEECREEILAHLCDCTPCKCVAETYQITVLMTRQLRPRPVPPQMEERLLAALAEAMKDLA